MPSPFSGMNPWLEQEGLWRDFHSKLLAAINERLVQQVRPKYIVLLERYIEAPAEVERDAHDVEHIPFLEMRDRQNGELVNVLEMLCPSNKQDDSLPRY